MANTVRALIASGKIMLDGKPLQWAESEDNVQKIKAGVHEAKRDTGGRPPKLVGRRGVAGGLKSNVRLKDQKRLRDELPVSTKHSMCTRMFESRDQFATAAEFWSHWGKQYRMRRYVLKQMYEKRSAWKAVVEKHRQSLAVESRVGRGASKGLKGSGITRHQRVRAAGGGKKKSSHWFMSGWWHGFRLSGLMATLCCRGT